MKLLFKRLLVSFLIVSFSLTGTPVWASAKGKAAAVSFFDDEEGPFVKRIRGRVIQNLSAGQLPPIPVSASDGAPSLDLLIPEVENSRYLNEILSVPNDPYYSSKGAAGYSQLDDLWGVKLLNAESAWDFTRGSGIVVAVVDTGVYLNHEELQGNLWSNQAEKNGVAGIDDDGNGFIDDVNGWDFVGNDKDPSDLNGHGTHVAGIIGALRDNNEGITGIAPEADVMAVRVLDQFGGGTFLNVTRGIRYAASMGARVINLSLGAAASSLPQSDMNLLTSAMQFANDLGAIVVAAAGNSFGDIFNQVPARFDNVISVGALRSQYDVYYGSGALSKASFSSFGEELDFMAPGVDILSLAVSGSTYTGYRSLFKDGSYYSLSDGTSMAAPMVSGAIALLLAQNPLQNFNDIYRRLRFSATDLGAAGFDNNDGWGLVNAFKALSEDYYDAGAIRTRFFAQPDLYQIVRREFDLSGNITAQYDLMGNRAVFEYWSGTTDVHRVFFYDISNILQRTNEYQENGITLLRTLYPDGRVLEYHPGGWVVRETFPSGIVHEYYSSGQLSRLINIDGSYTTYQRYYLDTDIALFEMDYDAGGNLLRTRMYQNTGELFSPNSSFTYFASGALESYADRSTGILMEYFDDNFYGNLIGRVSKISYPSGLAQALTYADGTETVQTRRTFVNGTLRFTDTMCLTCAEGTLQTRAFASGDNHAFFESGNWKEALDASTGTRYQYIDENFFGDKTGRFAKKLNGDGSYDDYSEYWPDSGQVKVLRRFSSGGALTAIFEYDENGGLVSASGLGVADITGSAPAGQPKVAANGHIAWLANDGNDAEVYLYDGVTTRNLSNNNFDDQGVRINAAGQIAWAGYDGSDYEIFFYDGSSVIQITNNTTDDRGPELNDAGKIAWENISGANHALYRYSASSTTVLRSTTQDIDSYSINSAGQILWRQVVSSFEQDIYLHNGTSIITVRDFGKNFNIKLADNGHAVWQREFASTDHDIVLYNGSFATSIAANFYFEINPDINSSGHVVYQKQESSTADYEIFLYKAGTTTQLTFNNYNDELPLISDNGVIVWRGKNELFVYNNGVITQLTNNLYTEDFRMSRNGRLTWRVSDGNDTEIFSYDGTSVRQLTDNNYDDGLPSINADGEVAWSDANGRMNYFSDNNPFTGDTPDFCEEASSCGHYASGRLKSKLLEDGTYREFLDENFFGDNTGRLMKEIRPDGSYTVYEDYFPDFDIALFQKDFSASGKLINVRKYDLSGNFTGYSSILYYPDGFIRSVTFFVPDEHGILVYEYLDEDWQGRGFGRVLRTLTAEGEEERFVEYYEGTESVKIKELYASGVFVRTIRYSESGQVTSYTLPDGRIYELYPSGNYKSMHDTSSGVDEEYYDENFYGTDSLGSGRGRKSKEIFANGSETRFIAYWPGSDKIKIKQLYQDGALLSTLEYAEDGVTQVRTILPDGDIYTYYPSGNLNTFYDSATQTTTTYLDENFYGNGTDGHGQGRKSREVTATGLEIHYLEYWPGIDTAKIKETRQSGILQKTEEYYLSGNLFKLSLPSGETETYYESGALMSRRSADGVTDEYSEAGTLVKKTLADGDYYTYFPSGNVSSHFETNTHSFYLDESFYGPDEYGHGLGRLSKALFSSGAETHYIAYYGRSDIVKTQHFFYNGVYQGMAAYDSSGRLVKETSADGSTRVYRYRRFPGKLELSLSTISSYDSSGNLIDYESYDSSERLVKWILYILESGERAMSYQADFTYHSRGYNLKELSYEYAEGILPFRLERVFEDHSVYNESNGVLTSTSRKTTSYIYNSAGRRYTGSVETFTYHPSTEQGEEPLKSHTTDRYEFNSNGNGTQRVFYENIQYLSDGQTVKQFERKRWTYYRSGRLKAQEVHVNKPGTIYHRIYEYDVNERVKQVRNFVHYESGNIKTERIDYVRITYEYKDENFDGMGKGRLIKKTNSDNTYEVYSYWGETDELSKIEYYRANGTRYRVDVFERLVPEDSGIEASAFGGDGYFDMLRKKVEERQSSSSQSPQAGFLAGTVSEL